MYQAGVPVTEAGDRYIIPDKFKGMGLFAWGFCICPAITKLYDERQST